MALTTLFSVALLLAGCGANMRAAVGTASEALAGGASPLDLPAALDPRFSYLRVRIGRQVGLMVRSDAAAHAGDPTTYWYSADGALLRLVDGRLAGLADGSRSWRVSRGLDPVDWHAVASGQALSFRRTLDQQPGYRIGVPQQRLLRALPQGPEGHQMRQAAQRLQWFVEHDQRGDGIEPTWYAVDLAAVPPRVIYGQACLAADWCIDWQPWPPRGDGS